MPIPVWMPTDTTTGGIPDRFLRPLVAQRRREEFDLDDGSTTTVWDAIEFLGRIGRGRATEVDEQGRQAALTQQTLYTNYSGLRTEDRILDDSGDEELPWELAGDPIAVWAADQIHHYEAPLRRTVG